MTLHLIGWAMEQPVGWPLAKLLLIRLADAGGVDRQQLLLGELSEFSGAHSRGEVAAALDFLARGRLVHLDWYGPPDDKPDIPFDVWVCGPGCPLCAEGAQARIRPAWVAARREWDRVRDRLMSELFARDGRVCRSCGATEDLTGDHVVPLRHGGTSELSNLQVLCRPCNTRKGQATGDRS